MTPTSKAFRAWKVRMGYTLRNVTNALGIARNTAGNYCTGRRLGKLGEEEMVEVPKVVLLACSAVEQGLPPVS